MPVEPCSAKYLSELVRSMGVVNFLFFDTLGAPLTGPKLVASLALNNLVNKASRPVRRVPEDVIWDARQNFSSAIYIQRSGANNEQEWGKYHLFRSRALC